jgi:hypothetical protein
MDILLATNTPGNQSGFTILPNPTSGIVNIYLSSVTDLPVSWKLYDHLGILHQQGKIFEANSVLEFGDKIPSGVYYIKIETDQNVLGITKVIIE